MYTQQSELIQDFRNFLFVVWEHLGLPEPTPVQYDIAQYLQDHDEKRIVIEAFRGVGKSYITSAYACHQLLLDPEVKILVVSASKIRADDFSTFTMRLITEMPLLQHLMPKGSHTTNRKLRKSWINSDCCVYIRLPYIVLRSLCNERKGLGGTSSTFCIN
jgi:tRNA(Met) C34 N-acetyltransferase TmcA